MEEVAEGSRSEVPPESSSATAAPAPTQQLQQSGEEAPEGEGDEGNIEGEGEEGEGEGEDEDDVIIAKAQTLMDKITANVENPRPNVLHALSSLLETEESRYMEETGHSSLNNSRSSHSIGRLGNLIQENDEFFELITTKFLSESQYSVSVRAATARLLFSCSLAWVYPHVFEDSVLDNIKGWVMDENDRNWKDESGAKKFSDFEMLKTFSTGLLAVCLAGGGQLVEDVLTSGLSAKLMRYLRSRVLGDTVASQKESISQIDCKNSPSIGGSMRNREETRVRMRPASDNSHLSREDSSMDNKIIERDRERETGRLVFEERDGESATGLDGDRNDCGTKVDGEEKLLTRDPFDIMAKSAGKSLRAEDADEDSRDELSRRRATRVSSKYRGKGRIHDGNAENEEIMTSPGSGIRIGGQGRNMKDRNQMKTQEWRSHQDAKKCVGKISGDELHFLRDESDDCFQGCTIGSKDITDLVKKAVVAAEAEAKAVDASAEAIKTAGDAAAELVKSVALEEFKKTNNEEAAVLAASTAASTVVDAANAVEVSRKSMGGNGDFTDSKAEELPTEEDAVEFIRLDSDSLAKLREKFCIQCLVILGEYVEVLGPVLHEKGVDVCLALLQRSSKHKDASKVTLLLPDVLKLICALAAHRKFAALFVDRYGMQKLLSVPRVTQTYFGLSSCLFTIGSNQGIMERVCALPPNVVHQVVELALHLLECSQDQARKNAALFFAAAFVFRTIIDTFDAQEGLQKLLNLLHDAASVRSGVPSGAVTSSGQLRNERSPSEVLTSSEKQIAYHTCVALRQYFRAHLILLVDSIRPSKNIRGGNRNIPSVRAAYKPLDISNEAMDVLFRQIQRDRKLGPAFVRARWPVVDKFLSSNGHITMLELCQAPTVERYLQRLASVCTGRLANSHN